jgi:hypothetical protein
MAGTEGGLPHLDDHEVWIGAPAEAVFPTVREYVDGLLARVAGGPLPRLLGLDPRPGFAILDEVPGRLLRLGGRHRFSRYHLVFELDPDRGGTLLRARSYAEFPGLPGRAYRAAVVGTRGHVLATRHMLRSIRRRVVT